MSAQIIDGKALAAATKAEAAAEAAALKAKGIEPCLAVILVGENPASQVYVRGKVKDCGECGINRTWTVFLLSTWAVCRPASPAFCPAPRRAASA